MATATDSQTLDAEAAKLLSEASAGSESSLTTAYKQLYPELHRKAYRIVRSPILAEDIVQEAFASTLRSISTGKVIRSPRPWLHMCVRNLAVDTLKESKKMDAVSIDESTVPRVDIEVSEKVNISNRAREILGTLSDLPKDQKSVFMLSELKGYDYRRIARFLSTSEGSVRVLMFKARRKIREALGPEAAILVGPIIRLNPSLFSSERSRRVVAWLDDLINNVGTRVSQMLSGFSDHVYAFAAGSATAALMTAAIIMNPSTDIGKHNNSLADQKVGSGKAKVSPGSPGKSDTKPHSKPSKGPSAGSGGMASPPVNPFPDDSTAGPSPPSSGDDSGDDDGDAGGSKPPGKKPKKPGNDTDNPPPVIPDNPEQYAYVANSGSNDLSVIDFDSNSVVATISVGQSPNDVKYSPQTEMVYVANSGSDSVSVVDTETAKVVSVIPVGQEPTNIVLAPDGRFCYVTNKGDRTVSVINTNLNKTVRTLRVGAGPKGIAVSNDGDRLYVANTRSNSVSVIDMATASTWVNNASVITSIPVGTKPTAIILSADESKLYVANHDSNDVSVINTATDQVINTVVVDKNPSAFILSPNGKRLFVINQGSGTMTIINTQADAVKRSFKKGAFAGEIIKGGTAFLTSKRLNQLIVVDTNKNQTLGVIKVGSAPTGVAFIGKINGIILKPKKPKKPKPVPVVPSDPPGSLGYAYVVNSGSSTVSVVDLASSDSSTGTTIAVGTTPKDIFISSATKRAYVANQGAGTVSVIDTTNNTVVETVSVGVAPRRVAVSPDGTKAYVAQGSRSVTIIDASTNTVAGSVRVGKAPRGITVSSDGTKVYVANYNSNTVSVIDTSTNTVVATVEVGANPDSLRLGTGDSSLYVSNSGGSDLSVVDTSINTVTATYTVGEGPDDLALSADGGTLYVANHGPHNVSVLNTSDGLLARTLDIAASSIEVGSDDALYFTNYGKGTLAQYSLKKGKVVKTVNVGASPVEVSVLR